MEELKHLSFYTGYGGAEWGLKKANIDFKVVGFSEIKESVIKLYSLNLTGHINYGDVTKINPNDLPNRDLITGGFPCQDVSTAGLRDLSKGRTKSVFHLLKIIKVKKPKYVLLENVKGILSMLNGELLTEIVRYLRKCGYAVSFKLLNSSDYGIPHNRERVFIAAELGRETFGFNPFPEKEELKISLKDLLEENVDKKYYLTKSQLKSLEIGLKRRERKLSVNRDIAFCLTASAPSRHLHDSNIIKDNRGLRTLTPLECFRLMGFLDDEMDFGDMKDIPLYEAAGNGWDINLVSKIFKKWLK